MKDRNCFQATSQYSLLKSSRNCIAVLPSWFVVRLSDVARWGSLNGTTLLEWKFLFFFQSLYSRITLWGSTWAANQNQNSIGTVLYNIQYIVWRYFCVYRTLHVVIISCSPHLYGAAHWKTCFSYKMINYNQTDWMKDPPDESRWLQHHSANISALISRIHLENATLMLVLVFWWLDLTSFLNDAVMSG